jgi:hypothetical protein
LPARAGWACDCMAYGKCLAGRGREAEGPAQRLGAARARARRAPLQRRRSAGRMPATVPGVLCREGLKGRRAPACPACARSTPAPLHAKTTALAMVAPRSSACAPYGCARPACALLAHRALGKSPDARGGRPCTAAWLSAAARGAADGDAALTRALALDWVALHGAGGRVWPALAAAAAAAGAPGGAPPPLRERCAWADAPVALAGAPLESARFATVDVGVRGPRALSKGACGLTGGACVRACSRRGLQLSK